MKTIRAPRPRGQTAGIPARCQARQAGAPAPSPFHL